MNAKVGIRVKRQLANAGIPYAEGVQQFGDLLKRAVKTAKFANVKAFAKAINYAQSNMSRISTGKRPPPMADVGSWADTLQLTGEKRAQFLEAARVQYEEHRLRDSPEEVRGLVSRLRLDAAKGRKECQDLRIQVADLNLQLADAVAKLDALRRNFRAISGILAERGIDLPKGLDDA